MQQTSHPRHAAKPWQMALAALACSCAVGPVMAQYKVVQPDGSTTYTDRPPSDGTAKVTPIGQTSGAAAAVAQGDSSFPRDLRLAAQRYPITLYTAPDCAPCDTGRQWLLQRGLPYSEKRILTQDDEQALLRLVGGRSVPSLTVGAQPVRGFSDSDWLATLDAAGYPRDSRLPRSWQPPAVTPLVATAPRQPLPAQRAEPQRPAIAPPATSPPAPGAIQF